MSRLAVDGNAAGHQRADAFALLHDRGVLRELQAPVQPASVDETEQEARVRHCRAEARATRLTRQVPTLPLRRIQGGREPISTAATTSTLWEPPNGVSSSTKRVCEKSWTCIRMEV